MLDFIGLIIPFIINLFLTVIKSNIFQGLLSLTIVLFIFFIIRGFSSGRII